jgi:DNA-directed RNA polymerase specialized sigma24 family protein
MERSETKEQTSTTSLRRHRLGAGFGVASSALLLTFLFAIAAVAIAGEAFDYAEFLWARGVSLRERLMQAGQLGLLIASVCMLSEAPARTATGPRSKRPLGVPLSLSSWAVLNAVALLVGAIAAPLEPDGVGMLALAGSFLGILAGFIYRIVRRYVQRTWDFAMHSAFRAGIVAGVGGLAPLFLASVTLAPFALLAPLRESGALRAGALPFHALGTGDTSAAPGVLTPDLARELEQPAAAMPPPAPAERRQPGWQEDAPRADEGEDRPSTRPWAAANSGLDGELDQGLEPTVGSGLQDCWTTLHDPVEEPPPPMGAVARVIDRMTRRVGREQAEDIAYGVLLKVCTSSRAEGLLADPDGLRQYYFKAARNAKYDVHRVRSREACGIELELEEVACPLPGIEQSVAARQDEEIVRAVLCRLPEEERELLVLHYFEGIAVRGLAALGRFGSKSKVQRDLDRALRRFRALYQARCPRN